MNVEPNKVKSIFLAAVELGAPDQREAFIDEACEGDLELLGRVQLLLRAHHGKDTLFDGGGLGNGLTLDPPIAERAGTVIGPYKLHEQIGEGAPGRENRRWDRSSRPAHPYRWR